MAEAKEAVKLMKNFEDMTREELLHAIEILRTSMENGWRIAARLSKEKLLAEKRCLPQFLTFDK